MSDATDALKVERKPIDGRHPLALELTRALGIDPSDCTGWTLRVEVDEFVSIEVRRTGETDSLGKLKEVVERRCLTVSPPEIKAKTNDLACLSKIDDEGLRTYASLLISELRIAFPDEGSTEVRTRPGPKGQTDYDVCLHLPAKPPQDKLDKTLVRLRDSVPTDLVDRVTGCLMWDE